MASRLEEYARNVIADPGRPGPLAAALRGGLACCAGLYEVGLEAYLQAEHLGLRRRTHLPIPVVSIGNLSVGGTGKTPLTQWLCRGLAARGRRVAVLSRGHGGTGAGVRAVLGERTFAAEEFGDEPTLLARTLTGVPVLVGKDRRLSGREALRRFGLDALVLDDGFQYWQLARDLDIVLLDAALPFDNGHPLPRGLLREPKRHLCRAGVVVVTRSDHLDAPRRAALSRQVAVLAPGALLSFARHRAAGLADAFDLAAPPGPLSGLTGRRVVAVSGIAQPASFERTLIEAGADVAAHLAYDDHARYGPADVLRAEQAVIDSGASALVMTEKDAVKWPAGEGEVPVYALRIEMDVEDGERLIDLISSRLFRRHL